LGNNPSCFIQEVLLAEQVVENLTSIIKEAAAPHQVVSLPTLRRAMGVNLPVLPDTAESAATADSAEQATADSAEMAAQPDAAETTLDTAVRPAAVKETVID
jgi:hypothetical protein